MPQSDLLTSDLDSIDRDNLMDAMAAFYEASKTYNEARWQKGDFNYKSCYGEADRTLRRNDEYHLNYIEADIDTIAGIASEDNKIPTFIPVNEDRKTPDQLNKLYVQCNNRMQYDRKFIKARKLTLISGECFVKLIYNTAISPKGYPDFKVIPYNSYMSDEGWIDCTFDGGNQLLEQEYVTKPQAIKLFPEFKDEILNYRNTPGEELFSFDYRNNYAGKYQADNIIRLLRYNVRSTREAEYLLNPITNEAYFGEFDKEILENSGMDLRVVKYRKPTWKIGIALGRTAVYYGVNPLNVDLPPFVPMYFERHPEYGLSKSRGLVDREHGIVSMLQKKMLVQQDLSDAPTASITVLKKRAISNPEEILNNRKRHKLFFLDDSDMKAQDAVYKLPYQGSPPSDLQLAEFTLNSVQRISGVTDTLTGIAKQDRVTTATSLMRDNSSKQSFAEHFKIWNESVRQCARVWLEFVQKNWDVGRIRQEIQEEPTEQFRSKAFSDYNVAVSEVEKTDTWRNRSLATLIEIAQYSGNVAPPASELAKLSNAPQSLVEQLEAKEKQASEMEAEERKMNIQLIEEKLKVMIADAFRKIQSGFEREDKRDANRGLHTERESQSIKNLADAYKADAEAKATLIKALSEENVKLKTAMKEYEKTTNKINEKEEEYGIEQEEEKAESEAINREHFGEVKDLNVLQQPQQQAPTPIVPPEEV